MTDSSLHILSHCACGGHVSVLRTNIRPHIGTKRAVIKVGGSSDTQVSSKHRYFKVRQQIKELGYKPNGSYGILFNPLTRKHTSIYRDDKATRGERIKEIL